MGDLEHVPEVALWRDWGQFLTAEGFRAVETEDFDGPRRYINYALDQAILTEACRIHLRQQSSQRFRGSRRN